MSESGSTENVPEEVRRLRAQVFQLKNIIKKLTGQQNPAEADVNGDRDRGGSKKGRKDRKFDFGLYKKRHVLFKVSYFGWDYHGFAVQEITGKTIESELFRALAVTRLIESRETSNYHRCGRTDKGVSAFSQIIRSQLLHGVGVFEDEGCRAAERKNVTTAAEIDYCKMLNSVLPEHIQAVAWAPCARRDFSARFDCVGRTYKYFFPRGGLDLGAMNEAGARLLGEHDFRNFCKMDVNNGVVNYMRRITEVKAETTELSPPRVSGSAAAPDPYTMCLLTVAGKAFLWHQIRCVVAVLFRVGEGKESPGVIDELLNVERNPRRPQYVMASELPLNLFDCQFDDDVDWRYDEESMAFVVRRFQALWTEHQVKASMLRAALERLHGEQRERGYGAVEQQASCLISMGKGKTYTPLLDMLKCPSLEEKVSHNEAKKMRMNDGGGGGGGGGAAGAREAEDADGQ